MVICVQCAGRVGGGGGRIDSYSKKTFGRCAYLDTCYGGLYAVCGKVVWAYGQVSKKTCGRCSRHVLW